MDDFSLAPEPLAQPLDLTGIQTPPFVTPQTPNKKDKQIGGMDRQQAMKLAIMLPLAMKAGPGAVQGLLQGFNAHEQSQRKDSRQDAIDARAQQAQDAQQQYQQGQLTNQRQTQQRQFLSDYTNGLDKLDDPAAIDAFLQLYTAQGGRLGLDTGPLATYAQQYAEPTRLQKKAAERKIAQLKSEYGADKWMEMGAQFTHQLPGSPQPVTFDQLLQMAGQSRDPNAPKALPKDKRGFTTKDVTVNGKRMLAGFDPDSNTYYAPGDQTTPLTGDIQEYNKPTQTTPNGLPPRVQSAVNSQSKGWDSLPIVKTTQKQAEAVSFANSLDPNTKNPADDQALIYAFAKGMDPDSVVREGEYATVQKYAQSWAQSFGFNAARVFSNTAFLTPQARQNMKRTIQMKYRAGKAQYDNVRRSYASKINKLTGSTDGEDYLTDYAGGFPTDAPEQTTPAGVTVQPPARSGGAGPATAPGPNPFRRGQ